MPESLLKLTRLPHSKLVLARTVQGLTKYTITATHPCTCPHHICNMHTHCLITVQ